MALKETGMKDTDKVAHRLALLEGLNLSPDDLESIATEIEDLERVVAELEEFSQGTPWIALQVQPADKKI
jgi:Asp-tRNA(Asn)/Glu-tRNA(Gln) amidotransferase C subunit